METLLTMTETILPWNNIWSFLEENCSHLSGLAYKFLKGRTISKYFPLSSRAMWVQSKTLRMQNRLENSFSVKHDFLKRLLGTMCLLLQLLIAAIKEGMVIFLPAMLMCFFSLCFGSGSQSFLSCWDFRSVLPCTASIMLELVWFDLSRSCTVSLVCYLVMLR